MKLWQKILLGGIIGTVVLLILIMQIPIWTDASWWWFLGFLFFALFVWLIIGIVLLIRRLSKKPPVKLKIDLKDAKARVIYEMKYDDENPDNFKIDKSKLVKIGERGKEKTPIAVFDGAGTELRQRRVAIVNLNNPKQEITWLPDPSEDEIKESIRLIAEHPPEEEIKEETIIGTDKFGRPITTTRVRRPSTSELKEQKEKEAAEEAQAM